MKSITVVVPTFNEESNILLAYNRIKAVFNRINGYDYRILFVDNYSTDKSRDIIRELAKEDNHIQYIFYVKNFGFSKSTFYGLTQSTGDATVLIFADMQDPPEVILDFIKQWELGYKVVVGIKNKSRENKLVYMMRQLYYSLMKRITEVNHIEQFTGFGLYDKCVTREFAKLSDPMPYLRGIVAELAPECKKVYYEQKKREHGKSAFKFWGLYDLAMLGITSYSKALMRVATVLGAITATLSFAISIVTIVLKLMNILDYPLGNAALIFGVYFIGGMILLFLGILGEYISNINIRTMGHPIIVEEERFNIEKEVCDT